MKIMKVRKTARTGTVMSPLPIPPRPPGEKFELVSETFDGVRWITDDGTIARYLREIHVDVGSHWHTIEEIAEWYGVHWRGSLLFCRGDDPEAGRWLRRAADAMVDHFEQQGYQR
ncbi:MAG: hypothetical protein Q4C47_02705 [Planctomycetia bacterium]|nr:hypothetical protein [Planctomycetia bacterium]